MAETDVYAWANDEAADWFHLFWKGGHFELVMDTILHFDVEQEEFDSVRAAIHVLCCFGSAYAFPVQYLEQKETLILASIEILNNMLNPPNDLWNFLESWDYDEGVIANLQKQIDDLQFILHQ